MGDPRPVKQADYTLAELQSLFPQGFADNLEVDPQFVAPGLTNEESPFSDDYHLQAGSPAIDAGVSLAVTTASGADTTSVPVDSAGYFSDGFGLVDGDPVQIGNNPLVRVTGVDYAANVLTVSAPVTFAAGDKVDLPYNGAKPDIGAYEFSAAPEIRLDTVTAQNGVLTVMGVITSGWGKEVTLQVLDAKNNIAGFDQAKSGNAGSFRFTVPLQKGKTYSVYVGGAGVQNPVKISLPNDVTGW